MTHLASNWMWVCGWNRRGNSWLFLMPLSNSLYLSSLLSWVISLLTYFPYHFYLKWVKTVRQMSSHCFYLVSKKTVMEAEVCCAALLNLVFFFKCPSFLKSIFKSFLLLHRDAEGLYNRLWAHTPYVLLPSHLSTLLSHWSSSSPRQFWVDTYHQYICDFILALTSKGDDTTFVFWGLTISLTWFISSCIYFPANSTTLIVLHDWKKKYMDTNHIFFIGSFVDRYWSIYWCHSLVTRKGDMEVSLWNVGF